MPLIIHDCEKIIIRQLEKELGAESKRLSEFSTKKMTDLSQYGMIYLCFDYLIDKKIPKNLDNFLFYNREQLKDACYIQSTRFSWNEEWEEADIVNHRFVKIKQNIVSRFGIENMYIIQTDINEELTEHLAECSEIQRCAMSEIKEFRRSFIIYAWHSGHDEYLYKFDTDYKFVGAIIVMPFIVGLFTGSGLVLSVLYFILSFIIALIAVAGCDYLKWLNPPQLVIRRIYKPSGEYRDVPNMELYGTVLILTAALLTVLMCSLIALIAFGITTTPFI